MSLPHLRPRAALLLVAIAACGDAPAQDPAALGARGAAAADAATEPDHEAGDALKACAAAGTEAVSTIDAVVARFNELPSASAACLVASLPRPLDVVATSATISAQPAVSKHSPRLFLLTPGIVITVVPEGEAASRVELGQWVSATRTIKAEIKLPFSPPLARESAFDHILYGEQQTSCALCHRNERPNPAFPGSYVSDAYRPLPSALIPLAGLRAEHAACVASGDTSQRCSMFHALFDFGAVTAGAFANDVALFTEE